MKYSYADPTTWALEPIRPRRQLVLRFALTLVCCPVLWTLWAAVAIVLFIVGMFADAIAAISTRFERGYSRFMDNTLGGIARLGSWFVFWPELRHEGDTEYYRERVDRALAHWTEVASSPPEPERLPPPVECAIPLRDYRGVGARYVAEAAQSQGWELRPTNIRKEVRLRWSAAAHGEDTA